jgi:hypothetical protein
MNTCHCIEFHYDIQIDPFIHAFTPREAKSTSMLFISKLEIRKHCFQPTKVHVFKTKTITFYFNRKPKPYQQQVPWKNMKQP